MSVWYWANSPLRICCFVRSTQSEPCEKNWYKSAPRQRSNAEQSSAAYFAGTSASGTPFESESLVSPQAPIANEANEAERNTKVLSCFLIRAPVRGVYPAATPVPSEKRPTIARFVVICKQMDAARSRQRVH